MFIDRTTSFETIKAQPFVPDPATVPVEISPRLQRYLVRDERRGPDHFYRRASKEQLYRITKETTDFIKEKEIKAVVLVDTSARLFAPALKTYWDLIGMGKDETPNVFFVDPDGFPQLNCDDEEYATEVVQNDHPFLAKHQDDPVLLFDTCMHSGRTISVITDCFEKAGFNNLLIGTASNDRNKSGKEADFNVIDGCPDKACYPFSHDSLVIHNKAGLLYSDAVGGMDMFYTAAPRTEIKEVITQQFALEHLAEKDRRIMQAAISLRESGFIFTA